MDSVEMIVKRARNGDLAAYAEIVRRFQDMAYGYAYSLLGDFHLAEDAAQQGFVEAWRSLDDLREPAAFAGWFRRIVFTQCQRLTRGRHVTTRPLETAALAVANTPDPAALAERTEMRDAVIAAIRALPDEERTVTTLFYINGYSQQDIADFLEAPVGTIKSRLYAARKRLKGRMINMVEDELKRNATDERFSKAVIEQLLARPKPLLIEGHPIREVWNSIRAALPDYEVIEGSEIEDRGSLEVVLEDMYRTYWLDDNRALRTQMTVTTFKAMRGRRPPVRLLAAGRVFRPDSEDATHAKVFHQADGLCIEAGADMDGLKATVERCLRSVFDNAEIRWEDNNAYGFVDQGQDVYLRHGSDWLEIAGCGLLKPETLKNAGYDPGKAGGYAFGLGLDRIAMLRHTIADLRDLWKPPYVPE